VSFIVLTFERMLLGVFSSAVRDSSGFESPSAARDFDDRGTHHPHGKRPIAAGRAERESSDDPDASARARGSVALLGKEPCAPPHALCRLSTFPR
jgi:hypothetical protein